MRALALVIALTASLTLHAAAPVLSPGFEHFYNLEYAQAEALFRAETVRQPQNPEAWNHLAQNLLYSEMFRAGALESELVSGSNPFVNREKMKPSPEVAKTFDDCIAKSMSLTEQTLAKNPDDIVALYAQGVAYGLRANYNYLVRKAWMDALKDATTARKAHNRITEIDPSNIDARMIEGVHDYILGSLPWHTKMLGFLAGFRGDREEGMKALRLVADKGNQNIYDAGVLLAAIYRRERKPLEAIPLLAKVSDRFPRNYLFRLEMVQMYSDAGNKPAALDVLGKVEAQKKAELPALASLPLEKVYYYRGNLLFWYREYDAAIEQLRRSTKKLNGFDLHSATMTWMRLGQCLDMKGQRNEAREAYRQAIKIGPETDVAKEAKGYLEDAYRRRS